MTLLVRDEEDILEANLDFHLSQGVDFFIVTDNLSQDNTPAILERYRRRGLLLVIQETRDDYSQHEWVTRMARMAASDCGAEWVINNDADEFWWPEVAPSLKSHLATIPANIHALTVHRANFPDHAIGRESSEASSLPFYERLVYRDTASTNALGRPLPPKVCHRADPGIVIAQGNHAASHGGAQLSAPEDKSLCIFHFPARSYAQFANKIRLGGAAYERNNVLDQGIGITWRHLFQEQKAGRLPDRYRSELPSEEQLLTSGRYLRDERLRDHLRKLWRPSSD